MEEIKNCMFQYATRQETFKDTGLITRKEADELWEEYQEDIKNNWCHLSAPQMCIWINCDTDTDYSEIGREIDFRDCELLER